MPHSSVSALLDAMVAVANTAPPQLPRERAKVLRTAVRSAVDELRARGRTLGRTVYVLLKLAKKSRITRADLIEQIVAWCVQRYYAPVTTEGRRGASC